jgi:hypothetical protein
VDMMQKWADLVEAKRIAQKKEDQSPPVTDFMH